MQRDRRKRYSPARHPVLLRRVLLVLCILAVLWLGYSCMMPQLLFSARGTMIFVPDPPCGGSGTIWNALRVFRVAAPNIRIVPWAALASCWPLPQQLLPVSATGGGRRRCTLGIMQGIIFLTWDSETPAGVSESLFHRKGT